MKLEDFYRKLINKGMPPSIIDSLVDQLKQEVEGFPHSINLEDVEVFRGPNGPAVSIKKVRLTESKICGCPDCSTEEEEQQDMFEELKELAHRFLTPKNEYIFNLCLQQIQVGLEMEEEREMRLIQDIEDLLTHLENAGLWGY